jgi:hypothetical protein
MYAARMATQFLNDPVNIGWLKGFGVFRMEPWHFAGLFHTRQEAEQTRDEFGPGYEVAYGSHRRDSDDFVVDER